MRLRVAPDAALEQAVAGYWIGHAASSPLVKSESCVPETDGSWICTFPQTPVAATDDLTLLFGEGSEGCDGWDQTGCPWPVAFRNAAPIDAYNTDGQLTLIDADDPGHSVSLSLQWDDGQGSPITRGRVHLLNAESGLRFGGPVGPDGRLEAPEGCELWSEYGCAMPPDLAWKVSLQLEEDGIDRQVGTWYPVTGELLVVPCPDDDGDGAAIADCDEASPDCDDADPGRYPGAGDIAGDGIDQDCDGEDTPEDFDVDDDGYLNEAAGTDGSAPPDCDDTDPSVHPGAWDGIADGVDRNCSGDEDFLYRFAGVGLYNGEGLAATEASLSRAQGLLIDPDGQVWISDTYNDRVRVVDGDGLLNTVAGNGIAASSGDGGAATLAAIDQPYGLAMSGTTLYFAEGGSGRVRAVLEDGTVVAVAGGGTASPGDGGPATKALLVKPFGLAVDVDGRLYVADLDDHRVRRVDTDGTLHTIAGTGVGGYNGDGIDASTAQLNGPAGIAMDLEGRLLIADALNNRVRRVALDGTIETVAGTGTGGNAGDGGPATDAALLTPRGLAVDPDGLVYVADTGNHRVRVIDADGVIDGFAGSGTAYDEGDGGPASLAGVPLPSALAAGADGSIYIGGEQSYRVRRVDAAGTLTTFAGNGTSDYKGDGGPATLAHFGYPSEVAVDAAGAVYLVDTSNCRVRRVAPDGRIGTVVGSGSYGTSGDGGPATLAGVAQPEGLILDGTGSLFLADSKEHRVRRVDAAGIITTVAGIGLGGYSGDDGPATDARLDTPTDVAVDADGALLIADKHNHRIRRVDPGTGTITTIAGDGDAAYGGDGGPATTAQLQYPRAIAVWSDALYIADTYNHRVRQVVDGVIDTVAGDGTAGAFGDGGPATEAAIAYPVGIVADRDGALYISSGAKIRQVVDGFIYAVAGVGPTGNGGEGGPATSVPLDAPFGLAMDAVGNLFIADFNNHAIQVVRP